MRYLDTSILVAALTREPRTEEMQDWLAAQAPDSLCISDWVLTEFSAALSMKKEKGDRFIFPSPSPGLVPGLFRSGPVDHRVVAAPQMPA